MSTSSDSPSEIKRNIEEMRRRLANVSLQNEGLADRQNEAPLNRNFQLNPSQLGDSLFPTSTPVQTSHVPLLPKFKYDGRGSSETFIENIEDFFVLSRTPEEHKVLVFASCLTGQAKHWFGGIRRRLQLTQAGFDYNNFKSLFLEIFPSGLPHAEVGRRLFSRRQRYEKCLDFAIETARLYEKWDADASDQDIIRTIAEQLRPEVQDYLDIKSPSTVQECLGLLQVYDTRHSNPSFNIHRFNERWSSRAQYHRPDRNYDASSRCPRNLDFKDSFSSDNRQAGDKTFIHR